MSGDEREFRVSSPSAEALRELVADTGTIITVRTLFDLAKGWGGRHPTGAPVVVGTHKPPASWPHANASFVTSGVAAFALAKQRAGEKTVAVTSADIARRCLDLGLLDAIHVDLVPVVLGERKPFLAGIRNTVHLDDPAITPGDR